VTVSIAEWHVQFMHHRYQFFLDKIYIYQTQIAATRSSKLRGRCVHYAVRRPHVSVDLDKIIYDNYYTKIQ